MQISPRSTSEVDTKIGIRIRERRQELGFSQSYVADVVGITFQQLQKYETGQNRVSAATLLRIADVLRVQASDLLPGAKPPKPAKTHSTQDALALQLQHAFKGITSPRERRLVLEMARSLSANASRSKATGKVKSKR